MAKSTMGTKLSRKLDLFPNGNCCLLYQNSFPFSSFVISNYCFKHPIGTM